MHELKHKINCEFGLDTPKLQRIVSIIQSAFGEKEYIFTFIAILKNQKQISTHDLQDLIAIDNSVNNPVANLEIEVYSKIAQCACNIVFRSSDIIYGSGISILVRSNNVQWASNLFSELEEQVDRIILTNIVSKYRHSIILRNFFPFAFLMVLIGVIFVSILSIDSSRKGGADYALLIERAKNITTTEQKIDFMFENTVQGMQRISSVKNSGVYLSSDLLTIP